MGRKPIQDEFSALSVSNRRKTALRRRKLVHSLRSLTLGKWASISECDAYPDEQTRAKHAKICGCKVTHVIFCNTPDCEIYVTGSCYRHRNIDDFSKVSIIKFKKTVKRLIDSGVTEKNNDLAWDVHFELDPVPPEIEKEVQS